MAQDSDENELEELANKIEASLLGKYGPVLTGDVLRLTLGYSTMGALRQAASVGNLPVPTFTPKNRRGRFALSMDVAKWLASERLKV